MPSPSPDPALQALDAVLPLQQIVPVPDLVFGGTLLVAVVILHGFLMRWVQAHVVRREQRLKLSPVEWKADLVMASAIFALLAALLVEIVIWAAALKYGRLFPTWASAAYYAANTYTTLGYGTRMLPEQWQMVGPIMAISGLFTFGWTGSVLVDVVGRLGRIKDLAQQERQARPEASQGAG
jgi:hypothetical protein